VQPLGEFDGIVPGQEAKRFLWRQLQPFIHNIDNNTKNTHHQKHPVTGRLEEQRDKAEYTAKPIKMKQSHSKPTEVNRTFVSSLSAVFTGEVVAALAREAVVTVNARSTVTTVHARTESYNTIAKRSGMGDRGTVPPQLLANPRFLRPYPFKDTLKPHSNGPLYSNTVIGTLAVDGWAVIFGTARSGMGGLQPRPVPSSLYQM